MGRDDLKNKLSGKFIVLDGPDGCGKTTQAKLLAGWLQSQGVPTVSFRDPGDTTIGDKACKLQYGYLYAYLWKITDG